MKKAGIGRKVAAVLLSLPLIAGITGGVEKSYASKRLPESPEKVLSEAYAKTKKKKITAVKKEFTSLFPKTLGKVVSVRKINADEVYEVVLTNDLIFYYLRSKNGKRKFLMVGSLLDAKGNNLTIIRKNEIVNTHANEYYSLVTRHIENAIKIGNGDRATFYVFIDTDCPHCRRIFKYLTSNPDFTSYFFLLGLNRWSYNKAKLALCSENKKDALTDVMKGIYDSYTSSKMKDILNEKCTSEKIKEAADIVRKNRQLAERVKLEGTPFIIMKTKEKIWVIRGANIPLIESLL